MNKNKEFLQKFIDSLSTRQKEFIHENQTLSKNEIKITNEKKIVLNISNLNLWRLCLTFDSIIKSKEKSDSHEIDENYVDVLENQANTSDFHQIESFKSVFMKIFNTYYGINIIDSNFIIEFCIHLSELNDKVLQIAKEQEKKISELTRMCRENEDEIYRLKSNNRRSNYDVESVQTVYYSRPSSFYRRF